jgi:hypothetical protein
MPEVEPDVFDLFRPLYEVPQVERQRLREAVLADPDQLSY